MASEIPQLIVEQDGKVVQTISVTTDSLTIGRTPGNDIVLSHPKVSRGHAEVHVTGEGVMLTDLGSANGTLVGDTRLLPHQPHLLEHGMVIRIGPFTLTFQSAQKPSTPPAKRRPVPKTPQAVASPPPQLTESLPLPPLPPLDAEASATVVSPPHQRAPEPPIEEAEREEDLEEEEQAAAELEEDEETGADLVDAQSEAAADTPELVEEEEEAEIAKGAEPSEEISFEELEPVEPIEIAPVPAESTEISNEIIPERATRTTVPMTLPSADSNSRYLQDLPIVFHDNEFLGRFLRIFEAVWEPLEQRQDYIHMYFDPHTCPQQFIQWLASWLDITLPPDYPEARCRELIAESMDLYRLRGTAYGLTRMLEVSTGLTPVITQDPSMPCVFRVRIRIPPGSTVKRDLIEDLIYMHKPAHAGYILELQR